MAASWSKSLLPCSFTTSFVVVLLGSLVASVSLQAAQVTCTTLNSKVKAGSNSRCFAYRLELDAEQSTPQTVKLSINPNSQASLSSFKDLWVYHGESDQDVPIWECLPITSTGTAITFAPGETSLRVEFAPAEDAIPRQNALFSFIVTPNTSGLTIDSGANTLPGTITSTSTAVVCATTVRSTR